MECALAADDVIGTLPGYEIHAPYPVMTNMAHAIELALKSFLLSKGFDDVKMLGHNLVRAYNECLSIEPQNAILLGMDVSLLEVISDIHSSMTLRYDEPSEFGKLPVFGPMEELADQCLELCNAPSRNEIWGE